MSTLPQTTLNIEPLAAEQTTFIRQVVFENKAIKWGQIRWVDTNGVKTLQQEYWTTNPSETSWIDVPVINS